MTEPLLHEPVLRVTANVELTAFRPEDKPNLLLYLNDRDVAANTLVVPSPYTERDADDWFIHTRARREQLGAETAWAIRHATAGCIGGIGVFAREGLDAHIDELGYWLAAPFRGQGLMTEVVRRLSDHLFDSRPNLHRLQAFVFSTNPASVRVLEKAGFEREGYIRKLYKKDGSLIDAIVLAKIRN
jgi:ribosomal-protein-alanine N-acetyltransferase